MTRHRYVIAINLSEWNIPTLLFTRKIYNGNDNNIFKHMPNTIPQSIGAAKIQIFGTVDVDDFFFYTIA